MSNTTVKVLCVRVPDGCPSIEARAAELFPGVEVRVDRCLGANDFAILTDRGEVEGTDLERVAA